MSFNFKNEEEVQEYLKNIYIEYKFGCESEKNGNCKYGVSVTSFRHLLFN